MKKFLLCTLIALALIVPATAQLRFDVGLYKPLGVSVTNLPEADSELKTLSSSMASQIWLFLPEARMTYQLDLEPLPLKLGFGARAFSFLIIGAAWPNVFAELELGPIFVDAQIGGLAFGYYALNTVGGDFGNVLFPDLSVWYGFGQKKNFRVGGGITMFYAPDFVNDLAETTGRTMIPFVYYISGRFTILP